MNHTPPTPTVDATPAASAACAVDRSCRAGDCGCSPSEPAAGRRRGLRAALVGVACVLGCLAGPLAIGGFATLGGALAGEAWFGIAGVAIAVVVAVVLGRRRGSIC